ncbi:hypothetical protein Droror1_Dr00018727, partial [Drosera rotundifolia]
MLTGSRRRCSSLLRPSSQLLPPPKSSPSSPPCFPHPDRTINRATTTAKPNPATPPLPGRELAFAVKEPSWGAEYVGERTYLGPGRQTCWGAHPRVEEAVSLGLAELLK